MSQPGLGTRDSGLGTTSWRPSASLDTLKARAELFGSVRAFFASRGVLEVDTPMLSRYATVDRHIESFAVPSPESRVPSPGFLWLHTSPEFAMKRLLCAGSGPIYQICHVFRREESGREHNPEFTLLEWYRPGYDHHALMSEVEALVQAAGRALGQSIEGPMERLSYGAAFQRHLGLDPHAATAAQLARALHERGHAGLEAMDADDRDLWLDLAMSLAVAPRLGTQAPCFLYDFPAAQAALARIRPGAPPLAERFELFWQGTELANGFHELGDAAEQQARFVAELDWRQAHRRPLPPYDQELISALAAGLPPCAGVAIGLDRLLMRLLGKQQLAEVLPFDEARA